MMKMSPTMALEEAISNSMVAERFNARMCPKSEKARQPGAVIGAMRENVREALSRLTSDMIAAVRPDMIAYAVEPPHGLAWQVRGGAETLKALDARLIDRTRHFYGDIGS